MDRPELRQRKTVTAAARKLDEKIDDDVDTAVVNCHMGEMHCSVQKNPRYAGWGEESRGAKLMRGDGDGRKLAHWYYDGGRIGSTGRTRDTERDP